MVHKPFYSSRSNRRKENFLREKIGDTQERDKILIVCEDSKITPNYLRSFCGRDGLKLPNTHVKICGEECGSAPSTVLKYALSELGRDVKENGIENAYDKIYCVFDKDGHPDYQPTLEAIRNNPTHHGKSLSAINSIPCFEFWVLLHFTDSSSPFSNCSTVGKTLKEYLPGYKKDDVKFKNLHPLLKDKTSVAVKNSKKVLKETLEADTDNPSSYMHQLIEELISQSKR